MNGGYKTTIGYSWTPDRFAVQSGAGRTLVQGGKPLTTDGVGLLKRAQRALLGSATEKAHSKQYGASGREMRNPVSIGRTPLKHRPLAGPIMVEHTCEMCHAKFESGSKKATVRWCPACREKRRREQGKAWTKQNRTGIAAAPAPARECERCRKHAATSQSRWCKECQVIMHREYVRKRAAERREEKRGGFGE